MLGPGEAWGVMDEVRVGKARDMEVTGVVKVREGQGLRWPGMWLVGSGMWFGLLWSGICLRPRWGGFCQGDPGGAGDMDVGEAKARDGMGLAVDGVAVGRDMLGEGVSFRCAPKSSDHRGYMTVFLSRCGG